MTLIEVLIALAVIGAVFAALAAMQVSNLRITRSASIETQRLERAVDEIEIQKRAIERAFGSYLECPHPGSGDAEPADVDCTPPGGDSVDSVVIWGRPDIMAASGSVSTKGLVAVEVTITEGDGSLTFRQFVSCLESTETPRPSVAKPGAKCS